MKSEHGFYLFAAVSFFVAVTIALLNRSIPVALVSLTFSIGATVYGKRLEKQLQDKQEIIVDLIEDKESLRGDSVRLHDELTEEREEKEELKEAKKRENRRLSNLKRALKRKGIDTEYLIDKYDNALYAPLMVLTHISAPNNNTEDDYEFITSNLEALDTKMLHGSTRIIPPRNFDQTIRSKQELQEWFDTEVLGGRTDLTHKLEVISIADITQTFDRDATTVTDGPDFVTHTVSDLFDTDTVLPTEDLLDILARSDRISLEDELQENLALLVVPSASETQMEQVIEAQTDLEATLGDLTQIANTSVHEIETAFERAGIDDAKELAASAKEEAERLKDVITDEQTHRIPTE